MHQKIMITWCAQTTTTNTQLTFSNSSKQATHPSHSSLSQVASPPNIGPPPIPRQWFWVDRKRSDHCRGQILPTMTDRPPIPGCDFRSRLLRRRLQYLATCCRRRRIWSWLPRRRRRAFVYCWTASWSLDYESLFLVCQRQWPVRGSVESALVLIPTYYVYVIECS